MMRNYSLPANFIRAVCISAGAAAWLLSGTVSAQTEANKAATASQSNGERWLVTTSYDYYGAKDREPLKQKTEKGVICSSPGKFNLSSAANTELPVENSESCWVNSRREEATRQQIKYACKDGRTAETAARREADGSYASKVVVNIPEQGAVSVTRSFRRTAGTCDPAKPAANVPAPPVQPQPPAVK